MNYTHAKKIVDELISQLAPHCEVISEAGSIRRRCQEVGDVEIMAIAKKTILEQKDLFGKLNNLFV